MEDGRIRDFETFWEYYLSEHSHPWTQRFHVFGTLTGMVIVFSGVIRGNGWLVPLGFVVGYAFAWISHLFIQKNRPATFKYPWWSFRSDFRLVYYFIKGVLYGEKNR